MRTKDTDDGTGTQIVNTIIQSSALGACREGTSEQGEGSAERIAHVRCVNCVE
jgi:hypothetical protein